MSTMIDARRLVSRLLHKNISIGQIVGYAAAVLVGLTIVITAIQFYRDIDAAINGHPDDENADNVIGRDYLIISKEVSAFNTIGKGSATVFDDAEIRQLEHQPWVRQLGVFTSADFTIMGAIDFHGRGLSSLLFFEAIPDQFLDVTPDDWHFDPADPTLPIIISKDYLTLYNFGFAPSQGLPQISESVMERVPFRITVSGNGHTDTFRAHIVGFSSRLNTIAVPYDFMTWANNRYSPNGDVQQPSRLILEVNTPGDPAIQKFMDNHGYEVAGDKADNARANYFLRIVTAVVIAVGAIISILAFFILALSLYLLLQKNRHTLTNLMLLGYTPARVAAGYFRLVLAVNIGVTVVAVAIMLWAQAAWAARLQTINVSPTAPWLTIVVAVAIMAAITILNKISITRTLRRYFI